MKSVLIAFLRFYKLAISPYLPGGCRFTPTCSEYAMQAISMHGALKGSLLAAWRVLRCNPFCKGGWDPVPEHFGRRRKITEEK